MLTRLRQIALHPGLVPGNYLDQLKASDDINSSHAGAVQITPELKTKLEGLILQAIEDSEECPVCFNVMTDPRITSCSHVFCLAWYVPVTFRRFISAHDRCSISEVIARDPKCPMVCYLLSASSAAWLIYWQDRRPLSMQALVAPPPPTDLTQAPVKQAVDLSDLCTGSSAKIDQLIHLLQLIPHGSKSLVFSQFTSFLDKVIAFYGHASCLR